MKGKGATPKLSLDPIEWDFRRVTERDVLAATVWEYARESASARADVADWFALEMNGCKLGEFIKTAEGRDATKALAVRKYSLPRMVKRQRLAHLIQYGNFDFPAPWLARTRKFPPFSEKALYEIDLRPYTVREPDSLDRVFYVPIGFVPVESIIAQFTAWARKASKECAAKHGLKAKTGMKSAPPWQMLKQLAAYRITQHLPYAKAAEFLTIYIDSNRIKGAAEVLPTYDSKGAWSKAVSEAKKRIAEVSLIPR